MDAIPLDLCTEIMCSLDTDSVLCLGITNKKWKQLIRPIIFQRFYESTYMYMNGMNIICNDMNVFFRFAVKRYRSLQTWNMLNLPQPSYRCQSYTSSGRRCSRKSQSNSLCWQHMKLKNSGHT